MLAEVVHLADQAAVVVSVATVLSSSAAKLPGELEELITLANKSVVRVVKMAVVVSAVLVASEVMASLVSSKQPPELPNDQAAKVPVFVALEFAKLVAKHPGELAEFSTRAAFVDRLVSNVDNAKVVFEPLVVAESKLDKDSLVVVQSVARVATSALDLKDKDLVRNAAMDMATDTAENTTATDQLLENTTDTTRDGEYNMTKCYQHPFCPPELSSGKMSNNKRSPMLTSVSNAYFVK